jgi:hypothetical protein
MTRPIFKEIMSTDHQPANHHLIFIFLALKYVDQDDFNTIMKLHEG